MHAQKGTSQAARQGLSAGYGMLRKLCAQDCLRFLSGSMYLTHRGGLVI